MKPKTVKELRAEAKALGVPRYSKMRKAELLEAIAAHVEYDPADNSAKCYDLAINVMRNKLASFRQEKIGDCWLIQGDCREVLPLLTEQQETIFRMLVRGGPVSVSRISWVVWGIKPNGPPRWAVGTIRLQIHYMRKALEPHGITIRTCRGDGYMIDVAQHKQARALLADMPLVRDRPPRRRAA